MNLDVDALTDILSSLKLSSAVWSRGRFSAPWSVHTGALSSAVFHAVVRGQAVGVLRRTGERTPLSTGDLILFAHGDAHVMCDAPTEASVPLSALPREGDGHVKEVRCGGGGPETTILCGSFAFGHQAGSSFLSLLPAVIHLERSKRDLVGWFARTMELMDFETATSAPGAGVVAARLADVLFVQLLRAAMESLPTERAGWLAALRDPQIARAIAAIHTNPRARWRIESLAETASMSRSVFAERFTKLVGESPARYVARWRAHSAADLLRQRPEIGNAELAELVGYESEDAFSRAFKRYVGTTPRDFRAA